ncbi:MAG: hypothetical protein RIB60_10870 [Phycisphaerales bacterium]
MTTRAPIAAGLIAALLTLSACARQLNERPTLGNAVHTATFRTAEWADRAPGVPARTAPVDASPDRADWPARVFLVPVDGTVHGPVRHGSVSLTADTHRQQGLYPTVESALDLEGDTGGAQALEGVLAPFAATAELALMPVSLVLEPPFKNAQSPAGLHKRTPRHAWSSAPIAEPAE